MQRSEENQIRKVLGASSKQELVDLIVAHCRVDKNFRVQVQGGQPVMEEDAEFAVLKKELEDVIDHVGRCDGYYYDSEEDHVLEVLEKILIDAEERADAGEGNLALQMLAYVIGEAEDVPQEVGYDIEWEPITEGAADVVRAAGKQAAQDSAFRAAGAARALELTRQMSEYDADGADSFLAAAVCFADEDSKDLFFETVEELPVDTNSMLALIRRFNGEAAAREYMEGNVDNDDYREILIEDACEEGRFSDAEKLCLDRVVALSDDSERRLLRYWQKLLYGVYTQAGEKDKRAQLGAKLVAAGAVEMYAEVKKLLQQTGQWDEKRPEILAGVRDNAYRDAYMRILAEEGETTLLMDLVQKDPQSVFRYGSVLYPAYPQKTSALATQIIEKESRLASGRKVYKNLAGKLSTLADMGGGNEALKLLDEICNRYPRRTALQEELQAVRGHVASKSTRSES